MTDPRHDALDGHCYEGCPCLVIDDYPHANALREGPNTSKLPSNRVLRGALYTLAVEMVIAAAILAWRML